MFDSIATLAVSQNMRRELYRLELVDTPLAPYFSKCITSEDFDDMYIEIMGNTLCKAYLEDFYSFEIMSGLLAFEADRRAVNITINRFVLLCHSIFAEPSYGENQMLDRAFYDEEVIRLCSALEQQFHFAVSFACMRLKEQEIRNLMRISESAAQNQKSRGHDSIVFTF